jgi:hypothetical protein
LEWFCFMTRLHFVKGAGPQYQDREAAMKLPVVGGALVAVLAGVALGPAPARADSWCIRDSGGMLDPICAFSSAQDCIHAAIVGPSGAVCVQENAIAEPAPKPPARRYVARQWRPQRQADTRS